MDTLSLNEHKINSLIKSMQRIADDSDILGKNIRCQQLADDIVLQEITVPLGVLMFILESRPDNLPFVSESKVHPFVYFKLTFFTNFVSI